LQALRIWSILINIHNTRIDKKIVLIGIWSMSERIPFNSYSVWVRSRPERFIIFTDVVMIKLNTVNKICVKKLFLLFCRRFFFFTFFFLSRAILFSIFTFSFIRIMIGCFFLSLLFIFYQSLLSFLVFE